MKILNIFLFIGFLNAITIFAMDITTGRELPVGNSSLENMPRVFGCSDFIQQAITTLQELNQWIQNQKDKAQSSKFSKEDFDKFNKSTQIHIKNRLKEAKQLLDKADKESGVAI